MSFSPFRQIHRKRRTCGRGGIRTHDTREGILVFETSAFNHSATLPITQCALGGNRTPISSLGPRTNTLLCPREESNFHLRLRTALFYPLNYEGMLRGRRICLPNKIINLLYLPRIEFILIWGPLSYKGLKYNSPCCIVAKAIIKILRNIKLIA